VRAVATLIEAPLVSPKRETRRKRKQAWRVPVESGFKHRLLANVMVDTAIVITHDIEVCNRWGDLVFSMMRKPNPKQGCWIILYRGFAWDGPSGPAMDTPNALIPSGFHDCGYQACRMEELDADIYRCQFDELYKELCRVDRYMPPYFLLESLKDPDIPPPYELQKGMTYFRSGYHFIGVSLFAENAANPKNRRHPHYV